MTRLGLFLLLSRTGPVDGLIVALRTLVRLEGAGRAWGVGRGAPARFGDPLPWGRDRPGVNATRADPPGCRDDRPPPKRSPRPCVP